MRVFFLLLFLIAGCGESIEQRAERIEREIAKRRAEREAEDKAENDKALREHDDKEDDLIRWRASLPRPKEFKPGDQVFIISGNTVWTGCVILCEDSRTKDLWFVRQRVPVYEYTSHVRDHHHEYRLFSWELSHPYDWAKLPNKDRTKWEHHKIYRINADKVP